MRDENLNRLLEAMDAMVGWGGNSAADPDVGPELELARARLECLSRRVGPRAVESPYLGFLRRSVARYHSEALAASA